MEALTEISINSNTSSPSAQVLSIFIISGSWEKGFDLEYQVDVQPELQPCQISLVVFEEKEKFWMFE